MANEVSFAERVIKQRIARLENELDPIVKPTVSFGDFSCQVDPKDYDADAKLRLWGVAFCPPDERPDIKSELFRLKILAVSNPAEAYREVRYVTGAVNRLLDLLPPKPASRDIPTPKEKRLNDAIQFVNAFHERNQVVANKIPVLRARLMEQNEHHQRALKEQDLGMIVGIFEFDCPKCKQRHQIGVLLHEWVARKTYIREIYCSPNSSPYFAAFELEGIEG